MIRYPGCACFWLEPTGTYRVGLRRFTFVDAEHAHGHDASTITDLELPVEYRILDGSEMKTLAPVPADQVPDHGSKLWPYACEECGDPFPADAQWQAYEALGYVRSDTGETIWVRHVSGLDLAGALCDAPWLHEYERLWDGKKFVGSDGVALVAVCPNGHPWQVDGEASSGGHWTRVGNPREPASLTVSPSILAGDYHGFLQGGRFTDDLGS